MGGEENETKVLDTIGSVLMLRNGMAERTMRFWPHRPERKQHGLNTGGRWKASGEGADLQRPGSRILKSG